MLLISTFICIVGITWRCMFQSRNRDAFDFNHLCRGFPFIPLTPLCFNLVIEKLLISTKSTRATHLRLRCRFQSRNRETFDFNRSERPTDSEIPTLRFNLVIEKLLISTSLNRQILSAHFYRFNLVIEKLLISTLHGIPQTRYNLCFNLVIEKLLISTSAYVNCLGMPKSVSIS